MTPATEAILKALRVYLETDAGTGCVVLGGFQRVPAGKDWIAERAGDKTLILLGLDPVGHEQPTQGLPGNIRWQQNLSIAITTLYRLKEGDDPWGRRFADGAWLTVLLAGFCHWIGDPSGAGARQLAESDVEVISAQVTQTEYAPSDGADLDAGFVSVTAALEVSIAVPSTLPDVDLTYTLPSEIDGGEPATVFDFAGISGGGP